MRRVGRVLLATAAIAVALALLPWAGVAPFGNAAAADTTITVTGDTAHVTLTLDPAASDPPVVRVSHGAMVRLALHGLGARELHLHGYDIAASGRGDGPAVFVFEAAHAGRFPVEMHVEDDLLGRRAKAVLYLEVRGP